MGIIGKLAAVALLALSLEGCGGAVMDYDQNPMPREYGHTVTQDDDQQAAAMRALCPRRIPQ